MSAEQPPAAPVTWIDRFPWTPLVLVALLMSLAPFGSEPHLWEKLKMLFSGTLARPLDIFDLFMHGTPLALVVLKAMRHFRAGSA